MTAKYRITLGKLTVVASRQMLLTVISSSFFFLRRFILYTHCLALSTVQCSAAATSLYVLPSSNSPFGAKSCNFDVWLSVL
jgi:hypothetical protein